MTNDAEITSRLQIFLPTEQEPVAFRPAAWRSWVGHDPVADNLIRELGTEGRDQIDRDDLRRMAQMGDAQHPSTYLRLFIAVMIWGSGTTNGRGPRYTDKALRSRPGPVLEESAALVDAGELAEAYRRFRLPGVGPAFATKWLWAVGTRLPSRPRPLILDSRVWASLEALQWNSRQAAGSRLRRQRYVAYIDAVHRWADLLQAEPEALEFILFDRRGAL